MKQLFIRSFGFLLLLSSSLVSGAQSITGVWSGYATVHGQDIPIHLRLHASSVEGSIQGTFLNGPERSSSSHGTWRNHHLMLSFDDYARTLEADLQGDTLQGQFGGKRGGFVALALKKGELKEHNKELEQAQKLAGDWEISVQSPKGEAAWTLRMTPEKEGLWKAVILRIDGDTGGLYGYYQDAQKQFVVSHFAASGAALYGLKPQDDGTLLVSNLLHEGQQWTARRPDAARKENLAPPTKATEQTSVIDPSKPLVFSGVSLRGETVTSQDARFKNKVVIVAIGGSWCPNCHDEAPFLVELYKKYHARGLEIVDLSFEEEDQLKDPTRLRAFQETFQIPYPILLEGTPDQLNEKLPQGKNLNCWPTAFFVGRDGLVKETHAGFSGPATGQGYVALKQETEALIQHLLSE